MVFVREDIPVRFLSTKDKPIKALILRLVFIKRNGYYVVLITQIKITSPDT